MLQSFTPFLITIGGIVLIDLVLSGDNALVIGAAASVIPHRRRWIAIAVGGIGAIFLRILFTTSATFLLGIPFLQAIGGGLILWIAVRLLNEQNDSPETQIDGPQEQIPTTNQALPKLAKSLSQSLFSPISSRASQETRRLLMAIATITIADITMSLDNIVAVGAIAKGNVPVLVAGLIISIIILLIGSALIAELMRHIPWLIVVASFVLAWVSADLIWNDLNKIPLFSNNLAYHIVLYIITFGVISVVALFIWFRQRDTVSSKMSN